MVERFFFWTFVIALKKHASAGIRVESAGLKGRVQVKFKDWVLYVAEKRDIEDSYC